MHERLAAIRDTDEFRDVYLQVYREPPYAEDAEDADLFADRLKQHADLPGFSVTTARDHRGLRGFAYGLSYGTGWWHPRAAAPRPAQLDAALFYVYELAVLPESRGHGHGRALVDLLLQDRAEPFAVLAASNDAPARVMYRRWGWRKVGALNGPPDRVDLLARTLSR